LEVINGGIERISLALRGEEFHALTSAGNEVVSIEVVSQFLHGCVDQSEFGRFGTVVEIVNHDFLRDDMAIVTAELRDFILNVGLPSRAADVHRDFRDLVVVRSGACIASVFIAIVVFVDKEDSDVVLRSLVILCKVSHELNGPV